MAHAFGISRLLAALVVALAAGGGFDPGRDLPGYLEALFSPDNDLYDFGAFETKKGHDLDAKALASLGAEWKKESERVAAELKRLETDPQARFGRALAKSIPLDRFFKTIPVDRRDGKGVVFFIQKPPIDTPRYADIVASTFRGHIEKLIPHFETEFATKLGLERDPSRPALALFVLASRGAYDDYLRATFPGKSPDEAQVAHYDRMRGFAVTYVPGEAGPHVGEKEQRERVLHESVHALLHAYRRDATIIEEPLWFEEGLAEYFSTFEEDALKKTFRFGGVQTEWLKRLVEVGQHPTLGKVLVSPLPAVLVAKRYRDVEDMARHRAQTQGVAVDEASLGYSVRLFYDSASLLVSFLLDGENRSLRDGFHRYAAREIRGVAGESSLVIETGFPDLAALTASYGAYVDSLAKERLPHVAARKPPAPETAAPKLTAAPARKAIEFRPESARVTVARALGLARRGDLAGAREAIAKTAAPDADDVASLEALAKLSDAVLEAAKKDGKPLVLKGEKGSINGVVAAFDAREIVLVDYKKKEIRVPRSAFGLDLVVDRIRSKSLAIGDPATLATALLVAGKPAETALKGVTGGAADVVKKRAERWKALPDEALAAERLGALEPFREATPAGAELAPALEHVGALLGPYRATESAAANRDAILALGTRLLGEEFDRKGVGGGAFRNPTTVLPDGRVEIRHAFALPGDPIDFSDEFAKREALEAVFFEPAETKHRAGSVGVAEGRLTLRDCAVRVHDAKFKGRARYEFTYRVDTTRMSGEGRPFLLAAFVDDATGSFAGTVDIAGLVVENVQTDARTMDSVPNSKQVTLKEYRIALEHEKGEFIFSLDGAAKLRAPDDGLDSFRFVLLTHGQGTFDVSKLVLTGDLDPDCLAEKRAAFVAERSAAWKSPQ